VSNGFSDALMGFIDGSWEESLKKADQQIELLDSILDEDTQEIKREDLEIPEKVYDPELNKFVTNYKGLKCTCGSGTVYAGHSTWCELTTMRKDPK
jgi:hypothetical protein